MTWQHRVSDYYEALLDKHGARPEAIDASREGQRLRFAVLMNSLGNLSRATLLDVGCGYGAFKDYLVEYGQWSVDYTGVDVCPRMIAAALDRRPNASFEVRDIFTQPLGHSFECVIASGLFQLDLGEKHVHDMLAAMWAHTGRVLAFNMLSAFASEKVEGEAYFEPAAIVRMANVLSPHIILRHDYRQNDFTVIIHRERQEIVG